MTLFKIFIGVLSITVVTALRAQTGADAVLKRRGEADLPVVHTMKNFSTLIEFPPDQTVTLVTAGDKEYWVIEGNGHFLFIKPGKEGITTNLNVVLSNGLVYAFLLKEVSGTGSTKASADLQITVNPGEDPAELHDKLTAVLQENAQLKTQVADGNRFVEQYRAWVQELQRRGVLRTPPCPTNAANCVQLPAVSPATPSSAYGSSAVRPYTSPR